MTLALRRNAHIRINDLLGGLWGSGREGGRFATVQHEKFILSECQTTL